MSRRRGGRRWYDPHHRDVCPPDENVCYRAGVPVRLMLRTRAARAIIAALLLWIALSVVVFSL